jgi:hypothetical protein
MSEHVDLLEDEDGAPYPEHVQAIVRECADLRANRDGAYADAAYAEECARMALDRAKVAEARVVELEATLRTARSYHGNSIDPDECMECAYHHMPCRSAVLIDAILDAPKERKRDMTYVLQIEWEVPDMPSLVGPFDSRREAEDWAALNIPNGTWNVAPLAFPHSPGALT